MALLIDGYNLLHVTGFGGEGATYSFQRTREALLSFLVDSLAEKERGETTIVFDAADAPPGLPRTVRYFGITVRYASDYADADALIEQLIREATAPRSLLVVSSDHRIQRAARRRRAAFMDSDQWYSALWRDRQEKQISPTGDKPMRPLTASEIDYWVERFSRDAVVDQSEESVSAQTGEDRSDITNPFPPGYGEDLLRDEE